MTGAAIPALMVHGFLGSGADWQPVRRHLPARPLWCPDLPGHGQAALAGPPSLSALADHLALGLAARGWPRAHVVGYSLGGRIALTLAERHPQCIASLVLEGAHPGLTNPDERRARQHQDETWATRFRHEPLPQVVDAWYHQPLFAGLDETTRQHWIALRSQGDGAALAAVLSGCSLATQPDLRPVIARLAGPRHYVHGARDARFAALASSWQRAQPALQVHTLAAGHNCHLEQPAAFAALVAQLWSQTDD